MEVFFLFQQILSTPLALFCSYGLMKCHISEFSHFQESPPVVAEGGASLRLHPFFALKLPEALFVLFDFKQERIDSSLKKEPTICF